MARTVISANCPTANYQVAYHIDQSTPRTLYGDAQRLQQILLNILNNAIKVGAAFRIDVWLVASVLVFAPFTMLTCALHHSPHYGPVDGAP